MTKAMQETMLDFKVSMESKLQSEVSELKTEVSELKAMIVSMFVDLKPSFNSESKESPKVAT